MRRVYASARNRILDAAERVLLRDGLGSLSIEAVIGEAALSKGGFFHHFATRNALLAAITERLATNLGEKMQRAAKSAGRGAALRAQIDVAFKMPARERARLQALTLALIESASSNPAVAVRSRSTGGSSTRWSVRCSRATRKSCLEWDSRPDRPSQPMVELRQLLR